MLKKLSLIIATTALTVGCATTYDCKLGSECYGINDAYQAALSNDGNSETVMPNYSSKGKNKSLVKNSANAQELGVQAFDPYSGSKLNDKPIYQPPKPIRIWIAPWQSRLDSYTQSDPVLMGGQFMYVTIPGHWNMGELREHGGLSQALTLEPFAIQDQEKNRRPDRVQPHQVLELPREK